MRLPVLQPMRCDNGCGDCCGPVPVQRAELEAIEQFVRVNGIEPRARSGLTCPFYTGHCAIYPVRSLICRVFGHVEKLRCPRGYNTNDLTDREVTSAIREGGPAVGLLTELFRR